ncbi:MAG: SDR family oxidoreductase [Anaerolineaceae bacterium]|nr:SDR family oxidoreductase [Anaerolineaceae bacterium]
MTRFLVTGVSGLLGLNFSLQTSPVHSVFGIYNQHDLRNPPFNVVRSDLRETGGIEQLLDEIQPDVVINCAALTNIDQCETRSELAQIVNADLPGHLASITKRLGISLVQVSTDAVFNGKRGNYSEEDTPNPISVYSKTKLDGERKVAEINADALIVRVNFYGCSLSGQRSLAEWFYNNLSTGNPVNGFTDVFFCPLLVNHLVDVITQLVAMGKNGLYHLVSSESLSKYEFGIRLANRFGLDENLIKPITWSEGGLKAQRSPNLTLRTDKLARSLGRSLPKQVEGLDTFHELHQNGFRQRVLAMNNSQVMQD